MFAKGLSLLDDYDHEQLDAKGLTTVESVYPSLEEYQKLINQMLTEFDSDVFGKEKDKSFQSSIAQIEKGFGNLTRKWKSTRADSSKRDLHSLLCIAEIIRKFDVIAM
jgi:hypothetical protein